MLMRACTSGMQTSPKRYWTTRLGCVSTIHICPLDRTEHFTYRIAVGILVRLYEVGIIIAIAHSRDDGWGDAASPGAEAVVDLRCLLPTCLFIRIAPLPR
jgi:hypothetical protein